MKTKKFKALKRIARRTRYNRTMKILDIVYDLSLCALVVHLVVQLIR